MNETSNKKINSEITTDRQPLYSINSFRGLNITKGNQVKEVNIKSNNLTSRMIFEINNNKNHSKAKTINKNKSIVNRATSAKDENNNK